MLPLMAWELRLSHSLVVAHRHSPPSPPAVGASLTATVSSADALASSLGHMKSLAEGRPLRLELLPAEKEARLQHQDAPLPAAATDTDDSDAAAWVMVDGTGEDHGTRFTAPEHMSSSDDSDDSDNDDDDVAVPVDTLQAAAATATDTATATATHTATATAEAAPMPQAKAKAPLLDEKALKKELKAAKAAAKAAEKAGRRAAKEAKAEEKRKAEERKASREDTHAYEVAKARLEGRLAAALDAQQAADAALALARQQASDARARTKAMRQELRELKQARRAQLDDMKAAKDGANAEVDAAVPDATMPDATVPDATVPDATVPEVAPALEPFRIGNTVLLRSVVSGRSLRCTDEDGVSGLGGRGRWARWEVVGRQGDAIQLERAASQRKGTAACLRITGDMKLDAAGGRGSLTWLKIVPQGDGTVALQSRVTKAFVAVNADGSPKHHCDTPTDAAVDRFDVVSLGNIRAGTAAPRWARHPQRAATYMNLVRQLSHTTATSAPGDEAAAAAGGNAAPTAPLDLLKVGNTVLLRSVVSGRSLRCTDEDGVSGLGGRGRWARWEVVGRQGDAIQLERAASQRKGTAACLRITGDMKLDAAGGRGSLTWLKIVPQGDGTVALQSRVTKAFVAVNADGSPKHHCDTPTDAAVDRFEIAAAPAHGRCHGHWGRRRGCHPREVPPHVLQRRVERLLAALDAASGQRRIMLEQKLNRLFAKLDGAPATSSDEETPSSGSDAEPEIAAEPAASTTAQQARCVPASAPVPAPQPTPQPARQPVPAGAVLQGTLHAPAMHSLALSRTGLAPGAFVTLQSVKCGRSLAASPNGRVAATAPEGGAANTASRASVFEVLADATPSATDALPVIRLRNVQTGKFLRITTGGLDCSGSGGAWTRLQPVLVRSNAPDNAPIVVLRSARFARPAFAAIGAAGLPQDAHDFDSNEDAFDTVACHLVVRRVSRGAPGN